MKNGLRQGCTLAPSLFNVYLSAIITHWSARCLEVGVPVLYKLGRKLVGDCTVNSHLKTVKITDSECNVPLVVLLRELHQSLSIQHPRGV